MNKELIEAFRTARYRVIKPALEIRIGKRNQDLDQFLTDNQVKTWAFITPFNPRSQVISDSENEERLKSLKEKVEKYITFEGTGGGQADEWPLEKSLLILGIDLLEAKRVGRLFEQDAIVFSHKSRPAEIVVLEEIEE